jgi:purine-nucleoside phosphorylase
MKDMKPYQKAASYILARTDMNPKIGLILGSGLGVLADEMKDAVHIPFESIPNFVKSFYYQVDIITMKDIA